jgi:hypothetical protein
MTLPSLRCSACGHELTGLEFLDGLCGWWPEVRAVSHRCSRCGHAEELQVERDELVFGYTYWAGAPHFSPEERVAFPGLTPRQEGNVLVLELAGRTWRISKVR